MTLLPEIQRELSRVARAPQPATAAGSRRPGLIRRGATVLVAIAVPACVVAFVLVIAGAHHHARRTAGIPSRPAIVPMGPVRDQPGSWRGGANTCPRAPRERGLPPVVGCVSVIHADVDGDGRLDTVILYATLGHRRVGARYAPTAFWLVVRGAAGGELRTRLPRSESNPFILQHGNLNRVAGAELIVQIGRISSGSNAVIYTDAAGRLIREPVVLDYRGDSVFKGGFVCRTGPHPQVIQHTYELLGSLRTSPWRTTTTTYDWHGDMLRAAGHTNATQRTLPASATTLSTSCGTLDVPRSIVR